VTTPPQAGDLPDDLVVSDSASDSDQEPRFDSSPGPTAYGPGTAARGAGGAEVSEEVSALLGRARFLGELLAAWIIDSIWLICVSAWVLVADKLAARFNDLDGMEKAFVNYAHIALAGVPFFLVTFWVIIDLIGSTKRIWERRR